LAKQIVMTDKLLCSFSDLLLPYSILQEQTEITYEGISIKYYQCMYFASVIWHVNRAFPALFYIVVCGLLGCTEFVHIFS